MKAYKVGIFDWDISYMTAIMEFVNSGKELAIQMYAFTDWNALMQSLEANSMDALLIDVSVDLNLLPSDVAEKCMIFQLTEDNEIEENGSSQKIYKYQNVHDIAARICVKLQEKYKQEIKQNGLYGVYAPYPILDKSKYADKFAKSLNNCLLLKFEDFHAGGEVSDANEKFMYCLFTKSDYIEEACEDLPEIEGVKIMDGLNSYQDLKGLKFENLLWLKSRLASKNIENIVVDMGIAVIGEPSGLNVFDAVHVIVPGEYDDGRVDSFKKMIGYGKGSIDTKIIFVSEAKIDSENVV